MQKCMGGGTPFIVSGPPGTGKKTLIAEYARRAKSARRYKDGVFWIELGPNAQLVREIKRLSFLLGHRMPAGVSSVKAASAWLEKVLADKAVLVVLADAQKAKHVSPFLVGGERRRVLVTAGPSVTEELGGPHAQELRLGG